MSYFAYVDSVVLAFPGNFFYPNISSFYKDLHQFLVIIPSAAIMLLVDTVLITIGFYYIAILNKFRDFIRYLNVSNLTKVRELLIDIQKFHYNLLKKFELFSDVFGFTFTIQIASSVVFHLFIFFVLQSDQAIVFVPLFITVFSQFGAVCIFGEFIFSKTENFFKELYLTKWHEFNVKEQKMLLMMMYMAQRPFGLTAAGMYDINLLMFIQVTKAGFSFCAILYTFM